MASDIGLITRLTRVAFVYFIYFILLHGLYRTLSHSQSEESQVR